MVALDQSTLLVFSIAWLCWTLFTHRVLHRTIGLAVQSFCVLHARALNVRSCMVLCTPGLRCMCVFRLCFAWCIKGFWRKRRRRVVENPSAGVKSVRRNMFLVSKDCGAKGFWMLLV